MKKLFIFIASLSSLLILAGCTNYQSNTSGQSAPVSSGTQGVTTTDTSSGQNTAAQSFDVSMAEYSFTPNSFNLKKGQTTAFNVTNNGKMQHTFTITELGINESISPGETRTINVTPDQTGTFELFCAIAGHRQLGMVATVVVE